MEPHLAATEHLRLIQVQVERLQHRQSYHGRYVREKKVMVCQPAWCPGYYPKHCEVGLKTTWTLVRQHHRLNLHQNTHEGEMHRVPQPLKTTRKAEVYDTEATSSSAADSGYGVVLGQRTPENASQTEDTSTDHVSSHHDLSLIHI